ncbi:hypothetical protein MMC25_005809 [Agyrium rufum]|nr:hypothetical protein [Agyrium rufum]
MDAPGCFSRLNSSYAAAADTRIAEASNETSTEDASTASFEGANDKAQYTPYSSSVTNGTGGYNHWRQWDRYHRPIVSQTLLSDGEHQLSWSSSNPGGTLEPPQTTSGDLVIPKPLSSVNAGKVRLVATQLRRTSHQDSDTVFLRLSQEYGITPSLRRKGFIRRTLSMKEISELKRGQRLEHLWGSVDWFFVLQVLRLYYVAPVEEGGEIAGPPGCKKGVENILDEGPMSLDDEAGRPFHFEQDKSEDATLSTDQGLPLGYITKGGNGRPRFPLITSPNEFNITLRNLTRPICGVAPRNPSFKKDSFQQVTAQDINSLFHDPVAGRYATAEAFDMAIEYFYRHSMIHRVREFFTMMEDLSIANSKSTFRLMLRDVSFRRNLHHFQYLLKVMLERGIVPDGMTWVYFLNVLDSWSARLAVVREMRDLGLLRNIQFVRKVAAVIVPTEFRGHLTSGLYDVETSFRLFDQRFGTEWASSVTANRIYRELSNHNLFNHAAAVLKEMELRSTFPNPDTLKIFLIHSKRQRNIPSAMSAVQHMAPPQQQGWSSSMYDILFNLAWQIRYYNCCRMIWHLACVEGKTTYRMRKQINASLLRNTPRTSIFPHHFWHKSAGKVIAGIRTDLSEWVEGPPEQAHDGEMATENPLSTYEKILDWQPRGADRGASVKLAYKIIRSDVTSCYDHRLPGHVPDLLQAAYEMDLEWEELDVLRERSTEWKVKNAINVDIVWRKDIPTIMHDDNGNEWMQGCLALNETCQPWDDGVDVGQLPNKWRELDLEDSNIAFEEYDWKRLDLEAD